MYNLGMAEGGEMRNARGYTDAFKIVFNVPVGKGVAGGGIHKKTYFTLGAGS